MMTIDKFEALVNTMTKYIVVAIVMVAALYAVRFDAFAATIEATDETTEERMYIEETYALIDDNHAVEVYCEYDEGFVWVYTYEFDSVEDYKNGDYRMVAIRAIDMTSCETITEWGIIPW